MQWPGWILCCEANFGLEFRDQNHRHETIIQIRTGFAVDLQFLWWSGWGCAGGRVVGHLAYHLRHANRNILGAYGHGDKLL